MDLYGVFPLLCRVEAMQAPHYDMHDMSVEMFKSFFLFLFFVVGPLRCMLGCALGVMLRFACTLIYKILGVLIDALWDCLMSLTLFVIHLTTHFRV